MSRVEVTCLWYHINNNNMSSMHWITIHSSISTDVRRLLSDCANYRDSQWKKRKASPLISANIIMHLSLPLNSKGAGFIRIVIKYTVKISHLRGEQMTLLHVFCALTYISAWCLFSVWNLKYRCVGIWPWGLSHRCHNPFHKSLRFLFPKCMGNVFLWQLSYNIDVS